MTTPGRHLTRTGFLTLCGALATQGIGAESATAQIPLDEYTVRTMYSPPEDGSTGGGSYPRVVQVQHYDGMEGDLLVTFARRPSIPIFRSTDEGETWEQISEVEGIDGQPALYELPVIDPPGKQARMTSNGWISGRQAERMTDNR